MTTLRLIALSAFVWSRALVTVNAALIELYWSIGSISARVFAADGWGLGTVQALAEHIEKRRPNAVGVSARKLWRMMQFYETYVETPKLSALLRGLSWTYSLLIWASVNGRRKGSSTSDSLTRSSGPQKYGA
jgi:DUF1016 N-terminal domain